MSAYFDTSLLVGRYLYQEVGTRFAKEAEKLGREPIISEFCLLETRNALRAACFRSEIDDIAMIAAHESLAEDITLGTLLLKKADLGLILAETDRISARLIPRIGGKTLDTMHLAFASLLSIPTFATADKKQARCAEMLCLEVLLIS